MQTRGWFYPLSGFGNRSLWKVLRIKLIVNGLVLAEMVKKIASD